MSVIHMGPKKNKSTRASRPTLSDIALLAGVSITAVSLVLSGKGKERRLSDDVIERVTRAARSLDYTPNLLVRSMQSGSTNVLSFYNGFRHLWRGDLYMDKLSTSIQYAGGAHGYDILKYCDFRHSLEETYEKLNGGLSDGLIFFAPRNDDPLIPLLRASRMPTVLINSTDPEGKLWSVRDDMESGMRQLASALLELGHTRIAIMTSGGIYNADDTARVELLQSILFESGNQVPPELVRISPYGLPDDLREEVQSIMALPSPPTAIFCWHDRLGYQVIEQFEDLGYSIPDDMTIVGFDGLHWPSSSRHVLGSVTVDLYEMADAAISLMKDILFGNNTVPEQRVLPTRFDRGTTVGKPRSK